MNHPTPNRETNRMYSTYLMPPGTLPTRYSPESRPIPSHSAPWREEHLIPRLPVQPLPLLRLAALDGHPAAAESAPSGTPHRQQRCLTRREEQPSVFSSRASVQEACLSLAAGPLGSLYVYLHTYEEVERHVGGRESNNGDYGVLGAWSYVGGVGIVNQAVKIHKRFYLLSRLPQPRDFRGIQRPIAAAVSAHSNSKYCDDCSCHVAVNAVENMYYYYLNVTAHFTSNIFSFGCLYEYPSFARSRCYIYTVHTRELSPAFNMDAIYSKQSITTRKGFKKHLCESD